MPETAVFHIGFSVFGHAKVQLHLEVDHFSSIFIKYPPTTDRA